MAAELGQDCGEEEASCSPQRPGRWGEALPLTEPCLWPQNPSPALSYCGSGLDRVLPPGHTASPRSLVHLRLQSTPMEGTWAPTTPGHFSPSLSVSPTVKQLLTLAFPVERGMCERHQPRATAPPRPGAG